MDVYGQETHTHGHTGGEVGEGMDLNQSDNVYPGDKTPTAVWLTWISNNLSLKYINDIGRPKTSRRVGIDGDVIA